MVFPVRQGEMTAVAAICALFAAAGYVPDGHEWEDQTRLSHGALPPRAAFGSFPDVASARQVLSTLSPRTVSLDGETAWRFRWSRRPSERPVGFERPEYDVSGWDVVRVPCSWQAMGIRASGERFGTPIYVNQEYIFTPPFPANSNCWPRVTGNGTPTDWTFAADDNPVGSYRRDFDVPPDWSGDRIILRFDGVESFFYVWVNGRCLGFFKDSRSVAEFDATDAVRIGKNTLAVEVYRNSDGSYLECHDVYRLSGIHRSVYVSHVPRTYVRDVSVRASPVATGVCAGQWEVFVEAEVEGPDAYRLRAEAFAPDGSSAAFEDGVFSLDGKARLVFDSPALWSAEDPALYALVVVLETGDRIVDAAGFDLGFRESRIQDAADLRDRVYLFNGRPVKLKGVNRGESDSMYGHHLPDARLEQDLLLIKRANSNFIRNSHFPQPERFYYLANRLGFYVMDEANIESHGFRYGRESLSHEPSWRDAHLGRVRAMYERAKNQPCVTFWSLGNEAGPGANFKVCADWIRAKDKSRPIHYERNNEVADIGSCFYPTLDLARDIATANPSTVLNGRPVKYPFLFVEYAHNLDNNCGNLADFQRIFGMSERIIGGALWDFSDQSLLKRGAGGVLVQAWGGCFGEKPEGGRGIMDGIVTADRHPEPGYYEAKHVFQPFAASLAADGRSIEIENKYDFSDASCCEVRCAVLTNGVRAAEFGVPLDLPPHERRAVPVPDEALSLAKMGRGEVALRLTFALRDARPGIPAGHVVAEEQLALSPPCFAVGGGPRRGRPLSFSFSEETGELISIKRNGHELLAAPVTIDAFRVPTGGETLLSGVAPCFGRRRLLDGLRAMKPRLVRMDRRTTEDGIEVNTEIAYRGMRKEDVPGWGHGDRPRIVDLGELEADAPVVIASSRWMLWRDGGAGLETSFRLEGRPAELQRIGWRFVWAVPETDVRYFACGPMDNYRDRKSGCFPAVYVQSSRGFGFRYGCTQDGGSREDARFVQLLAPGVEIASTGGRLFAFSVSPYSPTELLLQPHPELLPVSAKTELGVYAKVRGLGSANCGPEPKPEDRLLADGLFALKVEISDMVGESSPREENLK